MSERRRPRNPGINLPKVSPRNPGITLPKISLLLLLLSASTIPCKVSAAGTANLVVAAALLAAPAQPAAAQSPLLAPFNLFKTFFKNNPLSNFRSSTTSPHPHHSSNTPLAPPPPPLNHRQPRFLPFVNVNNNNNFHRHNGGIQARHPQGSQLTSSSADFTPSEPITSFSQPVFTIVKPVKKPKKLFDGGFSSPNFDDNGNNGNSFVKSSFVKNSFNDFGGNSNGGFESSKNSGFKSSTANNQFFTTKSTFSDSKKPFPSFSNVVSSTYIQTATEIPINPTYSPTEDFINLPFSNTRNVNNNDQFKGKDFGLVNDISSNDIYNDYNDISYSSNSIYSDSDAIKQIQAPSTSTFSDFSRPSHESASGPNPAGSVGGGGSANRFFEDIKYRSGRYYDGYNDATIQDTKTGVTYKNVYNAATFYQDKTSSPLISEKDYSNNNENKDDLLYVEYDQLQLDKTESKRTTSNYSTDSYCGGADDLGFCALSPTDEIFDQSEISIDLFNQLDTNRIGFKSLPSDVSVINIDNLLNKCKHIVDMYDAHFIPNLEELRGQHDLDALEDLGNPWSWQTYQHKKKQLCPSEFSFILPNYAKDVQGVWYRIVNTKILQQKVAIDMCKKPGDPCPGVADCGSRSVCVQQYSYQFLLAVPPRLTDCPKLRAFKFPSACSCHME